MQERTDMRKVLLDHQHESKMTYLETLQTLVEAQKELKVQQSRLKEAAAALAAIKEVKEQARAEFRHKLSGDLAEAVLLGSRSKIRFAERLCFGGAVLSASRIASITGTNGPSFGRSGALDRT